jgi:hypothetical protein
MPNCASDLVAPWDDGCNGWVADVFQQKILPNGPWIEWPMDSMDSMDSMDMAQEIKKSVAFNMLTMLIKLI